MMMTNFDKFTIIRESRPTVRDRNVGHLPSYMLIDVCLKDADNNNKSDWRYLVGAGLAICALAECTSIAHTFMLRLRFAFHISVADGVVDSLLVFVFFDIFRRSIAFPLQQN